MQLYGRGGVSGSVSRLSVSRRDPFALRLSKGQRWGGSTSSPRTESAVQRPPTRLCRVPSP